MADKSGAGVEVQGSQPRQRSRPKIDQVFERYALVALLLILIAFFAFNPTTGPLFRSSPNINYILSNQSVTAIIALGMVVPLIAGYFDLSVSAAAGFAAVLVAALLCNHHVSIPISLGLGLLSGIVLGIFNGVLCAIVRLNALISTLATYTLIGGLLLAYTQGQQINNGFPSQLGDWTTAQWLRLPNPFWLLIVVALVMWYVTTQTPFGRKLTAIGSNENAARLAGISVSRLVCTSFIVSGLLGGLAGVLLVVRTGGSDATAGQSFLFPAIAAVFLGQTAFTPGRYNVWGTLTGVFLVAVAVNGLSLLGAQSWVQPVFNGAALLVAVAVSTLTARARQRRAGQALLEAGASHKPNPAAAPSEAAASGDERSSTPVGKG